MAQEKITGAEVFDLIYQLRYKCSATDENIRGCTELSPAEYHAIKSLTAGETITAGQFAQQVDLSPSRSSRVIDKMENAGYIEVSRNSDDRRSIYITLAPTGLKVKKEIEEKTLSCHSKIHETLTEEERVQLSACIKKLIDCL